MFDGCFVFGGQNQRSPLRHTRQGSANTIQQTAYITVSRPHRRVDFLSVLILRIANFDHAIDEHPQPHLGWNPPRTDMGGAQQPHEFEILHHVADRRGTDFFTKLTGQRSRPHRFTVFQIPLNNPAKYFAGTVVKIFEQIRGLFHRVPVNGAYAQTSIGVAPKGAGALSECNIKKDISCAPLVGNWMKCALSLLRSGLPNMQKALP